MERNREMRKRTTYNQLLFDKGINVLRRERIVFSTNGVEVFHYQYIKKRYRLKPTSSNKMNSKYITDLSVTCNTVNF